MTFSIPTMEDVGELPDYGVDSRKGGAGRRKVVPDCPVAWESPLECPHNTGEFRLLSDVFAAAHTYIEGGRKKDDFVALIKVVATANRFYDRQL